MNYFELLGVLRVELNCGGNNRKEKGVEIWGGKVFVISRVFHKNIVFEFLKKNKKIQKIRIKFLPNLPSLAYKNSKLYFSFHSQEKVQMPKSNHSFIILHFTQFLEHHNRVP